MPPAHSHVIASLVVAILPSLVVGAAPARDEIAPVPEAIYAGVPSAC